MNPSAEPGGREGEDPSDATVPASGSEPRGRIPSIPVLDVVLDPRGPGEPRSSAFGSPHPVSPARTAVYGLAAGLALMGVTFAALIHYSPPRAPGVSAPPASRVPTGTASTDLGPAASSNVPPPAPPSLPPVTFGPLLPSPWRLA
jgi:hypothetical protein